MPLNLSNTLVVGISSTALFDLSEADKMFREALINDKANAVREYREYMLERENEELMDGTGMPLVKALLSLNQAQDPSESPLVDVAVMSRNSPETGRRIFNNIRRQGLGIIRHAFTGGEPVIEYLDAYDVDLFLTTNADDAQKVIDSRACAAAIMKEPPLEQLMFPEREVRFAVDGDAVVFDESSEIVYKSQGLAKFQEHEDLNQDNPLPKGPYAEFLKKLAILQERLAQLQEARMQAKEQSDCNDNNDEGPRVKVALVTARSAPAELRVMNTLRHWGVEIDQSFFLGGLDKSKVLKAFRPHIFFDDQDLHLEGAAKIVSAGKVPYPSDSALTRILQTE